MYPVKSCAGIKLERARVGVRGFENDRRWLVVSDENRYITQRECSAMALIRPFIDSDGLLRLNAPGMPEFVNIVGRGTSRRFDVVLFKSTYSAEEDDNGAAGWLTEFLKRPCKLVRVPDDFNRVAVAKTDPGKSALFSFADAYPFLVISEASLQSLNERLHQPLPMNRFRPNIVVSGAAPYEEDGWRKMQIGSIGFIGSETCGRCAITTIDQATAERGKEPLITLSEYRKSGDKVMFGLYFVHENNGSICVGDKVQLG